MDLITLAAAKGYVGETADSLGAVKGAPATIKSITEIDGGHRVTFEWTGTSGTKQTSTLDVMNGVDGKDGKDGIGIKGDPGINGTDGVDGIGITSIAKTKTEGLVDTYTITFTDGSTFNYDVTNGKDGKDGSGSSTGEENVIESIKVNGVVQTVADDKSVDITVPTVDVDKNYVDTELAKKANTSDIPSLDGYAKTSEIPSKVSELENDSNYLSSIPEEYVTETELDAKGYLTEHQDISGKVDKVDGKSLISDTEIARLATVDNYDDTAIKAEIAKKADTTSIPSKVSELTNDSNYQTAEQVNSTVTTEIAKVVADAPEDLNTLKEMSDWIAGHEDDASAMNSAISDNKTAIASLQTGKADKSEIPTTVAELTDSADYAKKTDIPTTLPANGGNASTVNGHTVKSDVPANAKFTDTTYSDATTSAHGLMTPDMVTKLDGMGTSQGRNLIPYPYSQATKTVYGVTFTDNKDGSIGISGTQDGSTSRPYMGIGIWWNETDKKTGNISISANTYFTISANCDSYNAGLRYYVYDESGSKLADNIVYGNATKTLKFDVDTWVALCIETAANSGIYDCTCKPQLELGSIAHAYEPPIESNVNLKAEIDKISTSQGRNLIHYPYYNGTSYELNGITYTVNEADGTITVNGTATKESDFRLINPYEPYGRKTLELGQTYTLSDSVNQPNGIGYQAPVYFQFVRIDTTKNDFNYGISTNYGNMTWTASDANLLQYGIRIVVRSGVTIDNVVLKPMLEIGAIAHSYEPTTESNVNLKEAVKGLVTPQGKNLISYPYTSKEGTANGITWTVNDDGTITADGTATNNSFFNLTNYIVGKWGTLHAGTYTIMDGVNLPIGGVTLQIESTSGTQYKNKTFTIEQDVVYKIFIYIPKGTVADNITFKPMLEVGSIAHMYEPTTESNISLKSAIDGKADKSEVCVNMLNPTLKTSTSNGITCTNNGDGTYTLNGNATSNAGFNLIGNESGNSVWLTMPADGKIIFAKGDATSKIGCAAFKSEDGDAIYAGGIIPKGTNIRNIYFSVWENQTLNNVVIKPMLTTNLSATYDDFVPYTGDGKTLTHDVAHLNKSLEVLGKCKNLLNPTLKNITQDGITCKNNGDGTYTLNGTCSVDSPKTTIILTYESMKIDEDVKFICCTQSGSSDTFRASVDYDDGTYSVDYGEGTLLSKGKTITKVSIIVSNGATVNNIVFKPMITTNISATYDDFVPYTGDGETLASDVAEIKKDLGGLSFSASGTTLTITDGTNTWTLGANS